MRSSIISCMVARSTAAIAGLGLEPQAVQRTLDELIGRARRCSSARLR